MLAATWLCWQQHGDPPSPVAPAVHWMGVVCVCGWFGLGLGLGPWLPVCRCGLRASAKLFCVLLTSRCGAMCGFSVFFGLWSSPRGCVPWLCAKLCASNMSERRVTDGESNPNLCGSSSLLLRRMRRNHVRGLAAPITARGGALLCEGRDREQSSVREMYGGAVAAR